MLIHAEVNRRFLDLDKSHVLLTLSVDGWLAWPVVKERVWLFAMAENTPKSEQLKSFFSLDSFRRVCAGAVQLVQNIVFPRRCDVALLYEEREMRLPDGKAVHPHLGTLPTEGQPTSFFHYLYVWGARTAGRTCRGRMSDHGVGALVALLARFFRRNRSIGILSRLLGDEIGAGLPEIDREKLYLIIADQLARFRIRSLLFYWIFRRSGVKTVVVLDPDGKVPEIAAAKRLGLPVVEVQHGMFSASEPDYSWARVHRQSDIPLPIPDKVIVFGKLWRDELYKAGYWKDSEILLARNPVLGAFRQSRREQKAKTGPGVPPVVLFPTQPHLQDTAISFWRDVLSMQDRQKAAGQEPGFILRIRIHPLEHDRQEPYRRLAAAFPATCTLSESEVDAFSDMIDADIVAGFTSLMMIEALGLELPVINLRHGPQKEGFWETFQMSTEDNPMHECESPEDFPVLVSRCVEDVRTGVHPGSLARIHQLDGPSVESVLS